MTTQETEAHPSTHFSSDNLSVSVVKLPRCHVKFDIKVSPKGTEAAYQKALKAINKEVVVPGFRKGRAPDHMIKEKYQGAIQKEFVEVVLQTAFNETIHLTSIHPLKDGEVKRPVVHECVREKGAHFVLEFETRPHVPSVNLDELELKKIAPASITDNEKENGLEQVLLQFTTYEPITDRGVEENDFVDLNVELLEDPPSEVIHNQRTQVDSKGLPSWMREKVIGLKAGESAEGMTGQDPSLIEPIPDFQSVPFRVTVQSIWQGNKPAVDDELAKRVGLQTIDELHQKISERLQHDADEDAYRKQVQALEDLLIEKYPFEIPQTYVDANKEQTIQSYYQQMEREGVTYDHNQLTKIEQLIEQNTIRNLQLFFIYQKVVMENQLVLTQEDLAQEVSRQIALMSSGRGALDLAQDKEQVREHLHHLALDRKVKQFLIDRATK